MIKFSWCLQPLLCPPSTLLLTVDMLIIFVFIHNLCTETLVFIRFSLAIAKKTYNFQHHHRVFRQRLAHSLSLHFDRRDSTTHSQRFCYFLLLLLAKKASAPNTKFHPFISFRPLLLTLSTNPQTLLIKL